MHPRTLVLLAAGFLGGLGLASCGPTSACSSANCGGCCDSLGKCMPGGTAEACGVNGATCGRCGTGTVCQSGECRASSNGGGGGTSTGGGTATGGGGGATGGGGGSGGCRMITASETADTNLILAEYRAFSTSPGHYNYAQWGYMTAGTDFETFRLEVVYPNDMVTTVPPFTKAFTAVGYFNCEVCALFYEACSQSTGECGKTYLAQSGLVTISRADRSPAGRMTGQASNVRFNEWDLTADRAVTNGGCVQIASIGPWNVGWNNDGGVVPP